MAFAVRAASALCVVSHLLLLVHAKVYKRCELARELRSAHDIPMEQLATWVCIAQHESNFDTAARNRGSGDHGIFQISELYWCSATGDDILACGLPCSAFEDDDIGDDLVCAKRIYRQRKRLSGDGFTAWAVYGYYCKDPVKVQRYIAGCFDKEYGTQSLFKGVEGANTSPQSQGRPLHQFLHDITKKPHQKSSTKRPFLGYFKFPSNTERRDKSYEHYRRSPVQSSTSTSGTKENQLITSESVLVPSGERVHQKTFLLRPGTVLSEVNENGSFFSLKSNGFKYSAGQNK